jgi:hypothetical protein
MSATPSTAAGPATESSMPLHLSTQLEALSQVGETLTFRLLELEERLTAIEAQLAELHTSDAAEMLASTDERIARLEDLLSAPQHQQHLNVVRPLGQDEPPTENSSAGFEPEEEPMDQDTVPEDEEQPFTDELIA